MRSDPVALVPVKTTPDAKARLAHVLTMDDRLRLVHRLLAHVTGVLRDVGLDIVVLASGSLSPPDGASVWIDREPGLNRTLVRALARISDGALVVPADLPYLRGADVATILRTDADVVVARASDGGTNGLLLRGRIRPAFGADSALVHVARARELGLRAMVVETDGFRDDLDDEPGLIRALATSSALAGMGPQRRGGPPSGPPPRSSVSS